MAVRPSSSTAIELDRLVRCPVCLEDMEEARSLPCGHTYCTECLKSLVSHRGWMLNCPTCRLEVRVPNGDVSRLTRNYLVADLVENLKAAKEAAASEPEPEFDTICKNHPDKACELFCKKCQKHICSKCITNAGTCTQHEYESIGGALKRSRRNVKSLLEKNEKLLFTVGRRTELLGELKAKQTRNASEVARQISQIFSQHIEHLENRKMALEQEAFDIQWQNENNLSSEEERVQLEKKKIENTIKFCRKILDIKDPVLFLQTASGIQDKIFQAEPQELADHIEVGVCNFLNDTDSLLADVISNFGSVLSFGEGFALGEKEMNGAERPERQRESNSRKPVCPGLSHVPGPSHEPSPYDEPSSSVLRPAVGEWSLDSRLTRNKDGRGRKTQRNIVRPAVWKFYCKATPGHDVTFEDGGFSVRTRSLKNVAVIGKPGYRSGKRSWKVRVTNFPDGISVGICLGRYRRGNLAYTYDLGFTKPRMERDVFVELDCDSGELSILPDALPYQLESGEPVQRQPDVLRFDNPENYEIYPYFNLPSPGRYAVSKITILNIDGVEVHQV
ncbi:tripartite motif-containing protein 3-like [Dendronephthya gigantea]|uniref:tripartite motif-containing protein 3-like n=1 Tax=Dendronephthya gigantea TaxID=151771 RepID=UPI00106DD2E6|nr:tripartite motif-containing protein 3-like [Dendronephthya gigantea]